MSVLLNTTPCPRCNEPVPRGRTYKQNPKLCSKCTNRKRHEKERLIKMLRSES